MNHLPSAAAQLQSLMLNILKGMAMPGAWLGEFLWILVLAAGLALAGGVLLALIRRRHKNRV